MEIDKLLDQAKEKADLKSDYALAQLLFHDDVPVSEQEVNEWLDTIPNLSTTPSRREAYHKAYNVDEKIREQKRRSTETK